MLKPDITLEAVLSRIGLIALIRYVLLRIFYILFKGNL